MHVNRGLLFWGLALVTAGVVALGATQGWFEIPAMAEMWNLWPVILIVIGLAIVLSRTPFAVIGVVVAALVVGFAGGAAIAAGAGGFLGTCGQGQGAQETSNGDFSLHDGQRRPDPELRRLDIGPGRWFGLGGDDDVRRRPARQS